MAGNIVPRRGFWWKKYSRNQRNEIGLAIALLAPCLLILAFVIVYPLGRGFYLSLQNYKLIDPAGMSPAGLNNYKYLLQDKVFWESLLNTIIFSAGSVSGGFLAGLLLAVLLDQDLPFGRILKGISLIPWIVPYIVVAFLFSYMFNFDVGIINYVLRFFGLVDSKIAWLAEPSLAMAAVVTANIWNQIPFYMLMFLAGLQSIPGELKEAARIDGATSVQVFWHITLPHLQNIMVITTILMLIRNFNNFPMIWVMTQGGPIYSTSTLVIYIFRLAFSEFNFGYAATVGVVWLILLMGMTALYVRTFEREIAV